MITRILFVSAVALFLPAMAQASERLGGIPRSTSRVTNWTRDDVTKSYTTHLRGGTHVTTGAITTTRDGAKSAVWVTRNLKTGETTHGSSQKAKGGTAHTTLTQQSVTLRVNQTTHVTSVPGAGTKRSVETSHYAKVAAVVRK